MNDYRSYLFRGWIKARYSFEQAKSRCSIITAAASIIWATLYALIVHLVGIPDILKGKLIGVIVVLYGGALFIGAGCLAIFALLVKVNKLNEKQDMTLAFKRALKDIIRKEEEP